MSGITTHVLDTSRGRPASGVPVVLEIRSETGWREIGRAETDGDGRVRQLPPAVVPGFIASRSRSKPIFRRRGSKVSIPRPRSSSTCGTRASTTTCRSC